MEAPEKKQFEAQTVIAIEHQGAYADIGKVYHKLYEWAKKKDVNIAGRGLTIFLCPPNEFDPSSAVFEVCLPVEPAPQGDEKVKVKELAACAVAAVTVTGPYGQIPAHYTEMLAWLSTEGWEVDGDPREVYIKRPHAGGAGDPDEFVTEIQFPIKG